VSTETLTYTIYPEIPRSYFDSLYEYIYRKYLLAQKERFTDISKTTSPGEWKLTYSVLDSSASKRINVSISGDNPMTVTITPVDSTVQEKEIAQSREDIDVVIDFFEQQVRKNSIFFAWREGESIVPEVVSAQEKSLQRMFLGTQILLMALFMGLGLFLFFLIGPLVPIVLLAIQFLFVFYSNKIIARSADWHITEKNPMIHLLEYPLSPEDDASAKKISKNDLVKLKKEIYAETISKTGELDRQKAHQIFSKYGIELKLENLIPRKVNAYAIVKKIADTFGFSVPEIVVSNTLVPNAAASGPSPSRGIVLMTTGLFAQLDDEEILSVLGHEFGHLKGRDPLWLYSLGAVQYLFYFYVIFGLLPNASFLVVLLYFWALTTLTYFIAKFFEARADLTSAVMIGKPKVLADALEKIGFQRLLYERAPSFRVQEWLSFDPHPPIYFRIARLRNLPQISEIKHPLIRSAREVTRGFLQSLS
jgi:heat shock protein HtpX